MQHLIDGFRKFQAEAFGQRRDLFKHLATTQTPGTLFVSCSDSRVVPELLTQQEPGDLFVIRNVANLVPPYKPSEDYHGTSAALEFAVRELGVESLVVMGHSLCGGVAALTHDRSQSSSDFISQWVSIADPALEQVRDVTTPGEPLDLPTLERAVVKLSLNNLRTFPWIAALEQEGRLSLHGMLFDVGAAELHILDEASGGFHPIPQIRPRLRSSLPPLPVSE